MSLLYYETIATAAAVAAMILFQSAFKVGPVGLSIACKRLRWRRYENKETSSASLLFRAIYFYLLLLYI